MLGLVDLFVLGAFILLFGFVLDNIVAKSLAGGFL